MAILSEFSEESSSSSIYDHKYDVFLSFQGVDTRHGFTDLLYKALLDANISTFLDDEKMETGEDLKPELESVIKASRGSIIVLSKNYASSPRCLDELVLILEQHMISNHIAIPIFYHVEPTHVRKQQRTFGVSMAEHKQKMEAETNANKRSQLAQKIDRWIQALTTVANVKGKDVNNRLETEFIEEIVVDIYRRLRVPFKHSLPLLIGMDYSIEVVTSWLKDTSSNTGDILTILGVSGIGKTSLAEHVFKLHFQHFDRSSYIEDVGRRCANKFNGLLDLQKQLCGDIVKSSSIQVHDASIYTSMIEDVVARKKVLLVLDDIDTLDQLDGLLGSKGFYPGSKIIITTKDAWLTKRCALLKTNVKPKHAEHLLQSLHHTESHQHLCFHAFMCNHPNAGYEELLEKLVNYCEGHPLALEVLGRSLRNRDVAYWEGCVQWLKKEMGSSIKNVLRMSFETLSSNDKELFKHIACFFVGEDTDVTQTILQACDVETRCGIKNLIDRCLLSIGQHNEFMMHQLLQEMGRLEVRRESPEKPWKRSRLWSHEECLKVLKQKKGTGNIRGLTLDTRMLNNENLCGPFELETDSFSKMENLTLLQLNYVQISGSYKHFPEKLRWLCVHGFPLKSIPSDLPMENLVALDMSYSNIESFGSSYSDPQQPEMRQKQSSPACSKDKRLLGSLKILNLSFCGQLRSLGGFDRLPALERLIVANCIGLVEVCESIGQCVELVLIDLSYCNKLKKVPRTIGMLKKLNTLLLAGCIVDESRTETRDDLRFGPISLTNSLVSLSLANNNLSNEFFPSDSNGLSMLKELSLFGSPRPKDLRFGLISLPNSLVRLSLANSNLSNEFFPFDWSGLSMLEELCLDGNPIVVLPNCVRSLPRLEKLSMKQCHQLKSVEYPPRTLRHLDLCMLDVLGKLSLEYVVFDPEMSPLRLSLEWQSLAPSSFEIQGMVKIQPMTEVEEKVLCSLGWSDFFNQRHMKFGHMNRELEGPETQMYYQFGIFSTFYGGDEIPTWVSHRSKGRSISITIPSMPNGTLYKLRGLNFCFVQLPSNQFRNLDLDGVRLPMIKISNMTKKRTWMYHHYVAEVSVGGECFVMLSHWMFGMNEMEAGDKVIITLTWSSKHVTKECGVGFVYDDEKTDEDEEDALGYYKSWNHIVGGDLTRFELTTEEYSLNTSRFWYDESDPDTYGFDDNKKEPWFKALSRRNYGEACEALEKTYPDGFQNLEEVPLVDRIPPPLGFNEPLDDQMRELDDKVQRGLEAEMVGSSGAGGNREEAENNDEEYVVEVVYKESSSSFPNKDSFSPIVGTISNGPSNVATNLDEVLVEVPCCNGDVGASTQHVDRGSGPSLKTYIPDPTCNPYSGPLLPSFALGRFDIPKSKRKKKFRKTAEEVIRELDQPPSEEDGWNMSSGRRHRRLLMDSERTLEFPAFVVDILGAESFLDAGSQSPAVERESYVDGLSGNEATRGTEGCPESSFAGQGPPNRLFVTPPEFSCTEGTPVVAVDSDKAIDATKGTFVSISGLTNDASLLDSGTSIDCIPPGMETETKLADYSHADFYILLQIKAAEQVALMAEAANRGNCMAATELECVGLRDELAKHQALLVEQAQKMASVGHDLVQMQAAYEESQNKMKAMEAERSVFVDRLSQGEVARAMTESQLDHSEALRADADQKVLLLEASNSELDTKLELLKSEKKQLVHRVSELVAANAEHVGQLKVVSRYLTVCRDDLEWVLQEGLPRCFDKVLDSEAFVRASRRLRKACTDYGTERGCRLMRDKFQLPVPDTELPDYKPDTVREVKEAYSSFAEMDYMAVAGLAELSVDALRSFCLSSSDEESN